MLIARKYSFSSTFSATKQQENNAKIRLKKHRGDVMSESERGGDEIMRGE
jgi:hypothetical protein